MNLIIFREKHSNRHFVFNSDEELKKIFLKILKERIKEAYFSDYLHSEKAKVLINNDCSLNELKFFFSNRKEYEYEDYEITQSEEI